MKNLPTDIAIDLKKSEVRIKWQDELLSIYTLDQLRQSCPCAVCNDLREKAQSNPLQVLSADQANARGELDPQYPVEKVGQYALQFFWADGHRTGIYTYEFLRQLGTIEG